MPQADHRAALAHRRVDGLDDVPGTLQPEGATHHRRIGAVGDDGGTVDPAADGVDAGVVVGVQRSHGVRVQQPRQPHHGCSMIDLDAVGGGPGNGDPGNSGLGTDRQSRHLLPPPVNSGESGESGELNPVNSVSPVWGGSTGGSTALLCSGCLCSGVAFVRGLPCPPACRRSCRTTGEHICPARPVRFGRPIPFRAGNSSSPVGARPREACWIRSVRIS